MDDYHVGLVIGIIFGIGFCFMVGLITHDTTENNMKDKAVDNNAGCFYINEDNDKEFAWIENCPEGEQE